MLYDRKHTNYLFLDRGLPKHRHLDIPNRLERYMAVLDWNDISDKVGFLRYLLDSDNPMSNSLRQELEIKTQRQLASFTFKGLFTGDCDSYESFCDHIGLAANKRAWLEIVSKIALPRYFYKMGRYWDLQDI